VLILPATLTHDIAADLSLGLTAMVASQPATVVADASALQRFDSSALAILLACRREALASNKSFSVYGMPARLQQLAGLYGVAELVPQAV
jgi:phospholipid transport system transporter-binding protein